MKKNVLTLFTTAIGGGVERLILDQMKHFDHTKFNIYVVTLRTGYLDTEFNKTGATYCCLNSKRRISYATFKKLINYIKKNHIDIIHTHLYLPDIYGFLAKIAVPGIKLITTKHNTNDFRKKLYWGFLDYILALPASRIIAVSGSVKQFISHHEFIPSSRIMVIYHGVDVSRFKAKRNLKKLRTELSLQRKNFVIGIVGRITKQKGHKYLLEAAHSLREKIPDMHILIIGSGELENMFRQYCHDLEIEGIVTFLGYRSDMANLYSLMDVLCLPSIFEGLGLVLVEAMLCNTLTIGAEVDGIKEIIVDGHNGFLFPPRDSNALAELLYKIYKVGYKKEIIARARRTALRFDYRKNLREIENEYLRVCEGRQ
jgi:glycosyltransferase involved in cell wall biosynthesis